MSETGADTALTASQNAVVNPEYESVVLDGLAAAPAAPSAGKGVLYVAGDKLHYLSADGTDIVVGEQNPLNGSNSASDGRLTLVSGNPEGEGVTGGTLCYEPYIGNRIALCDTSSGSRVWQTVSFDPISLGLASILSGKNYDVYGYLSGGQAALGLRVWTNDSTRAEAITRYDGVLCIGTDPTKRLLGTIRANANGTCRDAYNFRGVANFYNRLQRRIFYSDAGVFNWSSSTPRQYRGADTRVYYLSFGDEHIMVDVYGGFNPVGSGDMAQLGIGYDTTSSSSYFMTNYINAEITMGASRIYTPTAGWHYISLMQQGNSSVDCTWKQARSEALINL